MENLTLLLFIKVMPLRKNLKVVCNVSSSNGNISGMGVAAREEPLTRILIGFPEDTIHEIVDVFCEEK